MENTAIMEKSFMTPDEIANMLRLTRRTVTLWLETGAMQGYLVGRRWRVPVASFTAFMEAADNSGVVAAVAQSGAKCPPERAIPSPAAPAITKSASTVVLSRAERRRQQQGRK